jgi:uncharacterized YigZ family protein
MIQLLLGRSRTTNAQDGLMGRGSILLCALLYRKTTCRPSITTIRSARYQYPLPRLSTTRGSIFTSFPRGQERQRCRGQPQRRSADTRLYNTDASKRDVETHHTTLASGVHVAEMEVKKSRFVGYAIHTESWSSAKDFLDGIVKTDHPKARHWCYGVSLGVDPVNERCSDDGEPTGTAGQPILQAIRTEGLSDAMCVVVRYFGGIKLGTGGLIRAYGGAARKVLREAPKFELIAQASIRVQVDAQYIGTVYEAIGKVRGTCLDEGYENDGSLTAILRCQSAALPVLKAALADSTKGSVKFLDDEH